MTIRTAIGVSILIFGLSGCGRGIARPMEPAPPVAANWRSMATAADRERLRDWRKAWTTALAKARLKNAAAIAEQGALFEPDRAISGAVPPAGKYRCRVFKLGANGTAMADYTRYPDFECRVDQEGDVSSFYKLTGAQRPVGFFLRDTPSRAVFLGTLRMGDEMHQMHYGRDAQRDIAGIVERIGDKRWRLTLPYPRFESLLDVIELVPAG